MAHQLQYDIFDLLRPSGNVEIKVMSCSSPAEKKMESPNHTIRGYLDLPPYAIEDSTFWPLCVNQGDLDADGAGDLMTFE